MSILPQPTQFPFDERYLTSGFLGIPGLNQSRERGSLDDYECYYVENLEPHPQGWTNYNIGLVKILGDSFYDKIQGMWAYENYLLFVANGSMYKYDFENAPTIVTGGENAFDSTARVRGVLNQGRASASPLITLYLCDGVSPTPFRYNGSFLETFGLGAYAPPATVIVWRGRTVWTFLPDSVDQNRLLFSRVEDGDTYNLAGASEMDAFDDECFPGDGDHIVGLGIIQFKGQDAQKDALVVCKSSRSFMGIDSQLVDGSLYMTFNNHGVDVGAVSPDAIVQFGNDLWVLTKTGIKGFNAVLQGSGGIASFSQSPSSRFDSLIVTAAASDAFSSAFVVHHAEKQKVRFFMPKDVFTSSGAYGYDYGEIPLNYCLSYAYGVMSKTDTNPRGEAFYARGGAGFAFFCACNFQGRLFLGDYFGNIWELDGSQFSDDYIPLPDQEHCPIVSYWETPYLKFGLPFQAKKRIVEMVLHARSLAAVSLFVDIEIQEDRSPFYKTINTLTLGERVVALQSKYNTDIYYDTDVKYASDKGDYAKFVFKPLGWGNGFGIRFTIHSKIEINEQWQSNAIWIYALTGIIERGRVNK